MELGLPPEMSTELWEKWKKPLESGEYEKMEGLVVEYMDSRRSQIIGLLMDQVTQSKRGQMRARLIKDGLELGMMVNKVVQIFTGLGKRVRVHSWYGYGGKKVKQGRPRKRKKPGPNGRGKHLLLGYWGFWKKYSPVFVNHVLRAGVASGSYELASDELKERGYKMTAKQIGKLVQEVGSIIVNHRDSMYLEGGESLGGKRIMIAIDGGRIRTRVNQVGRRKKGQKLPKYDTDWKEPKLLVIAEIDDEGKQKKDRPPIYEATMGNAQELYKILVELCRKLELHKAAEVVCLGDGADWVWNSFDELIKEFKLKGKVTQIVDWYHAVEHITQIADEHPKYQKKENYKEGKEWMEKLKQALAQGQVDLMINWVHQEAKKHNAEEMKTKTAYFEKRRNKMRYDEYVKEKLPIGSGTVESAIRRVINLRLKAPGTFWKPKRAERMLVLRCALKSGRWKILMRNFTNYNKLQFKKALNQATL